MSASALHLQQDAHPAIARLAALAPLDGEALGALEQAVASPVTDLPRAELLTEGRPIPAALLMVEGGPHGCAFCSMGGVSSSASCCRAS